jgi:hypothetical protein
VTAHACRQPKPASEACASTELEEAYKKMKLRTA